MPASDEAQLAAAVARGPVAVAIEADAVSFSAYASGVYDDADCGTFGDAMADTELYGRDVGVAAGGDVGACCEACSAVADCGGFVLFADTCYLKSWGATAGSLLLQKCVHKLYTAPAVTELAAELLKTHEVWGCGNYWVRPMIADDSQGHYPLHRKIKRST